MPQRPKAKKICEEGCIADYIKQILTFRQFKAVEATAKNFFDLPLVCYFLEQFSFDFMWKMNEKLDFLDTLASALKSYTILK